MQQLTNKRILLGITGGIAAYKSAELVRQLRSANAEVRVVMTPAACEFITPLTMQALSGNPVHLHMLDPEAEAAMGHIELARWADLILIAPATADFLARLSKGQGDDLLTTLCLASDATTAVAPAMNQAMWRDQATQENIKTLTARGIKILGPGEGEQACGDVGPGRMLEPETIAKAAAELFVTGSLAGKTVVITAGPTREALDPVRYISNHSSGKMGYALAEAAAEAGAKTTLISGPVNISVPPRVNCIAVVSAEEMLDAAVTASADCDIFIGAAAVADYRPAQIASQKIKKSGEASHIDLIRNPDIIATIGEMKAKDKLPAKPFIVGFAAETENLLENAKGKLIRKKLDAVIANDVANKTIGFNSDDNAVLIVRPNEHLEISKQSKAQLSRLIIAQIAEWTSTPLSS